MPVSRPIVVALGGALLALVAFFASSAMRGGAETSAPPAKPAVSSAPKAPKARKAPALKSQGQAAKPEGAKIVQSSPAELKAPKAANPKTAKPKTAKPTAAKPAAASMAVRVARAVKSGRTVVLLFYQRGGADDSATADAVAGLRGHRGVAVFTTPVSTLGDFRAVTGNLGLSQAPAVVIVGKKGKARVVEGFIDPGTLAQEVADSR
jgi:cytoskeletal protein RodZ